MILNDQPESTQRTMTFAEDMTVDQQTNRSILTVQQTAQVIPEHERKSYPSDLTDAQWQRIVPLLPPAEPKGRQNGVELREVINGILYVACDSYDLRSFPHDLPPMSTLYYYFRQWRLDGTWQKLLDALHPNVNLYKVDYRFIMTWQKLLDALHPEEYEANGHEELPGATPGNTVSGEPLSGGLLSENDDICNIAPLIDAHGNQAVSQTILSPTPEVSVVVPTRNEQENIWPLLEALQKALGGLRVEVIFIDDSDDDTPAVIEDAARMMSSSRFHIELEHRVAGGARAGGLATAVVHGMNRAQAEHVAVIDADLEHLPEQLRVFYDQAIAQDADLLAEPTQVLVAAAREKYMQEWPRDEDQAVSQTVLSTTPQEFRPFAPFRHALSASKILTRGQAAVLSTIILGCGLGLLSYAMKLSMIPFTVLLISLVFFAQSIFSLYLMLYSWEHPERLEASKGPCSFLPPQLSFTVLLPARHEEAVIYETIKRVWAANYLSDLLEIVVICHADDTGTIAEAQRAIREIGSQRIHLETFSAPPINKPRGLNVGFQRTRNQVVTIFDAEDDIDPDIFNMVNTIMLEERVGIIQAGVQLMNFRDHWFAVHNCMEYFFWFKSRLHFHGKVGLIPLGGNTVFIRRDLLERVGGWDEQCLTEDADIGLRLSALGEPIRVVYEAHHVTREETPQSVASFIRQRTRWQQGFVQVLRKGSWLALPRLSQRLLAVFTLSYPILQAFLTLLWLPAIIAFLWLKLPVLVVMISFLPLYALFLQFLVTIVGAFTFTREYGFAFPLFMPISLTITFLPYQFLLGISAIRAIYRELHQMHNWEKTEHAGAHRKPEIVSFNNQAAIDAETYDQERAIR